MTDFCGPELAGVIPGKASDLGQEFTRIFTDSSSGQISPEDHGGRYQIQD